MATTTEILELTLPAKSENFDLAVFNSNFTKIENAFAAVSETLTNINEAIDEVLGE